MQKTRSKTYTFSIGNVVTEGSQPDACSSCKLKEPADSSWRNRRTSPLFRQKVRFAITANGKYHTEGQRAMATVKYMPKILAIECAVWHSRS